MMPRSPLRLAAAATLTFVAAGAGFAQEARVSLRAGLLIDGTGGTRANARVIVDGTTITRV